MFLQASEAIGLGSWPDSAIDAAMSSPSVLVNGRFDGLCPEHVAFLREAARHGNLLVAVGSDASVALSTGRQTRFSEDERVYLLNNLACVTEAFIASGSGLLDFAQDLKRLKPDKFVVDHTGHSSSKAELCAEHGVDYVILDRVPAGGFPGRGAGEGEPYSELPYRVCIAGGWMDQPWVSEHAPGSVVVVAIEPTIPFNDRSGMATSTRRTAGELWGGHWPSGRLEHHAKMLFACDNPPGTQYVSGSQDSIGLVFPGINRLHYNGGYWPERIDSNLDPELGQWLESVIHLVPLSPRPEGYDPLQEKNLDPTTVQTLAAAGDLCWESILSKDIAGLGRALTETAVGWRKILPYTIDVETLALVRGHSEKHAGCCPSGCGGGYLIVVSDESQVAADELRIRVRLGGAGR